MSWDISIGQWKQWYGRVLQHLGRRFDQRRLITEGERFEYGGRLQTRYGVLKHQVQWDAGLVRIAVGRGPSVAVRNRRTR